MQEVIEKALLTAKNLGATYADVRLIERETEDLSVSNGEVKVVQRGLVKGFGVRVILMVVSAFSLLVESTEMKEKMLQKLQLKSQKQLLRQKLMMHA